MLHNLIVLSARSIIYPFSIFYEGMVGAVRPWRDGDQFGGCDVYNPWSVLMYMDRLTNSNNKSPESFWANTSGNDVLYRFIQQGNAEMKQDFDTLSAAA